MSKKINSVCELLSIIDKDSLEKCFIEYALLNIAKAKKLDDFLDDIEKMKLTDTITISEIKEKLS